jgi:phage replication-related protein YjqB (UPF0714/DUF867 family)
MLAGLLESDGVVETSTLRGRVGVMALHGGLEHRTAEAADQVARAAAASYYSVVQPDDLRWHVPSTHFDPSQSAQLTRFLEFVSLAVSFHGFGRRGMEGTVLLGGSNRRFAATLARAIGAATDLEPVADLGRIPSRLRGLHPRNPVNLPELGGVQLELSPQAREPEPLRALIDAVAKAITAEQASVCGLE